VLVGGFTDRRRLVAAGVYTMATSAAILLLNVGSGVMLARVLGPSGRGQLAALVLWPFLLANITATGMADAITYYTSKEEEHRKDLVGTSLLIALVQAGVYLTVAWFLMPAVLNRYGESVVEASRWYLAWIPLYLLWFTGNAVLLARSQVRAFNRVRLTVIACTVIGLVPMFVFRISNLNYIVVVYVLANGVALAVVLAELGRKGWLEWKPSLSFANTLWRYGMKASIMTVSGMTNERADQALISLLLPAYALGLYAIAVTVSAPVVFLVGSLSIVALPTIARARTEDERKQFLTRFVQAALLIAVVSALCLAALVSPIIRLFFGSSFLPATESAQILVFGAVALSLTAVLSAGLKAFNEPLTPGLAQVLANVVTVAALLALLPRLGILGAAIASLLAYSVAAIFLMAAIRRRGISIRQILIPTRSDVLWLIKSARQRLKSERSSASGAENSHDG